MTKAEERARKNQRDRNRRFAKLPPNKQRVQIAKDVLEYIRLGKIEPRRGVYMSLNKHIEKTLDFVRDFDPTTDIRDLDPVKRRKYIAQLGQYSELMDKQVCDIIDEATDCQVCGIGAVFVAAVRRADKLTVVAYSENNGMGDDQMREYLDQWFEPQQRGLIEMAFEKGEHMNESGAYSHGDDMYAAEAFGKKFKKSDDRLAAIMQNIIEHDGEFVPPPIPEEEW